MNETNTAIETKTIFDEIKILAIINAPFFIKRLKYMYYTYYYKYLLLLSCLFHFLRVSESLRNFVNFSSVKSSST